MRMRFQPRASIRIIFSLYFWPITAAFYAAREREHTTCATVQGPRHRANTTLSISRLLASRPPARATIKGPSSAWSIWREGEGGEGEGGRISFCILLVPARTCTQGRLE
jgi:hypothetical protein